MIDKYELLENMIDRKILKKIQSNLPGVIIFTEIDNNNLRKELEFNETLNIKYDSSYLMSGYCDCGYEGNYSFLKTYHNIGIYDSNNNKIGYCYLYESHKDSSYDGEGLYGISSKISETFAKNKQYPELYNEFSKDYLGVKDKPIAKETKYCVVGHLSRTLDFRETSHTIYKAICSDFQKKFDAEKSKICNFPGISKQFKKIEEKYQKKQERIFGNLAQERDTIETSNVLEEDRDIESNLYQY